MRKGLIGIKHGKLQHIPFPIQIIQPYQKRWKNGQSEFFSPLLPRIYMIVEEINERFCRRTMGTSILAIGSGLQGWRLLQMIM